ncbi:hypothetical protein A2U01_0044749, partial [Trifolium medium]|nr:hypothetical protein [Trifolium medium]
MYRQREERLSTNTPVTANHVQRRRNVNGRGHHSYHPNTASPALNHKKPTYPAPVTCQYCEKPGHIAKNCFEIRGYPKKHRTPTVNLAHMTATSSSSPPDWL